MWANIWTLPQICSILPRCSETILSRSRMTSCVQIVSWPASLSGPPNRRICGATLKSTDATRIVQRMIPRKKNWCGPCYAGNINASMHESLLRYKNPEMTPRIGVLRRKVSGGELETSRGKEHLHCWTHVPIKKMLTASELLLTAIVATWRPKLRASQRTQTSRRRRCHSGCIRAFHLH